MEADSGDTSFVGQPIALIAQINQLLVFFLKFHPELLILLGFVLQSHNQRVHFAHGQFFSLHRHLLIHHLLGHPSDFIGALLQLCLHVFFLLKQLLGFLVFLLKCLLLLLKSAFSHLNTGFEVFGALVFILAISFFVFLLLYQVKLSLYRCLSSFLLRSRQGLEFVSISERIPC